MPTIDLNRHIVLRASAGTGKTHEIVELVVRFLTETGTRLEQILLVTFTEKATGELKARLRAKLEGLAIAGSPHRGEARAALDVFDQAAIFTIHGFCQRVLQDHAFENREDVAAELVDDGELMEPALREVQRTAWVREYGTRLASVLESAKYSGKQWEQQVCKLALAYRRAADNCLLPIPAPDLLARLDEIDQQLRAEHSAIRALACMGAPIVLEDHPWWQGYSRLNFHRGWRSTWMQHSLRPILEWLNDSAADERPQAAFGELVKRCARVESFKRYGFPFLTSRAKTSKRNCLDEIRSNCPSLEVALERLEQIRKAIADGGPAHALAVRTVTWLQEQQQQWKGDRGQQSYEDMLTRVDTALDPAQNPSAHRVREGLRQRYQVAVVDEFQDTDPLQWRIFRRVFVDGATEQRLIVVGDPKQAIYGFRGADLNAFMDAVSDLKDNHGAADPTQDTNWRSEPALLDALNQLFGAGGWFPDPALPFTAVQPAPEDKRRTRLLVPDQSQRPALSLVKFENPKRLSDCRRQMARFIAREINGLLHAPGGPCLRFQHAEEEHYLQAGDVRILVASRREATQVEEELRRFKIPYTFYKQSGLWRSCEAVELAYVLRAVARPDDRQAFARALLTRFFRLRPEALAAADDLSGSHAARILIERWREWSARRRWAALFHSIRHDTGLLLADPSAPNADRLRANLFHITQILEQLAYARDLDLNNLVEVLEGKTRGAYEDDGLQPIETDRSKVRLMTIHVSKGLEFPVVFVAGGFTARSRVDFLRYHQDAKLILDLRIKDEEAKARHDAETLDENRRLYYVAFTRAMFKLYVPWVVTEKPPAASGPLATFIAAAITQAKLADFGAAQAAVIEPDSPLETVDGPAPVAATASSGAAAQIICPTPLFPALPQDLGQRRVRIRSFSSLHRQAREEGPTYIHEREREGEDTPAEPRERDAFRGPVFGEMLHEVLEEIDFAEVAEAETPEHLPPSCRALIEEARLRHWAKLPARAVAAGTAGECAGQLADLTWNALHVPLPELGRLCDSPRNDRLHEVEFHFPATPGSPLPPGIQREEGFLTGFMDLVVRRAGRFYLLDWKSNTLPAYGPDEVACSMVECDYVRQYRIYLQALDRWLKKQVRDFRPLQHLAGVFYLYVRGISPAHPQNGVYHHRPERRDFDLGSVLRS